MQNKGAITLLAVLIGLVSIYQLSFTFKTSQVENVAKVYAESGQGTEKEYLDSISNKTVYNILGIAKFSYKECKELELNMGLDLKGGMNVTMGVDVADVIVALSEDSQQTTFKKAIEEAKRIRKEGSSDDFITLFGEAYEKYSPNTSLADANIFTKDPLKSKIKVGASNKKVLSILRKETDSAIDNIFLVLRNRIDQFGVIQPNIRKSDIYGRIVIELPGIKDPERVKNLLEQAAVLEFYETFDNPDFIKYLEQANKEARVLAEAQESANDVKITAKSTVNEKPVTSKEVKKDSNSLISSIAQDSLNKEEQYNLYLKQNPLFTVLHPNVNRQSQAVQGSCIGYASLKDTAKINKLLATPQIKSLFPRNAKLVWEMKPNDDNFIRLHAIKIPIRGKARLDGSVVTDARKTFDSKGSATPSVSMNMNGQGAREWAKMTKENVGHCIAIVLDGKIASSPNVNGEITGGSSSISGSFTIQEAEDLANILKSGKIMAKTHVIASDVVGPSLGRESITSGMWSFIIAFGLILVYMLFFYSKGAGFAADVALVVNLFFIFGILASFGAVLTLPGIAGIVLTMGMSVDANVLIYERIIEELKGGKGMKLAIKEGYNHAYSAIIDGNVTTLLTGFILYYYGEGPIKGFATTLIIGIFTSLFTAIFISRLILDRSSKNNKIVTFSTKSTKNWLSNIHIKFLKVKKIPYIISSIILVICITSLCTRGLDKGIDFVGGRTYVVKFDQPVNVQDIASSLEDVFDAAPEVKTFGGDEQVKITTKFEIDKEGAEADKHVGDLLFQGLTSYLKKGTTEKEFNTVNIQQSQKVGPAVASDVARSAYKAVIIALIVIFLYIMMRFTRWQYSAGAVLSLMHDVLIVIGIFSLFAGVLPFSLEVDQSFIAAILTVVGYSINDTVVIFDRIREYIQIYPKRARNEISDLALNSTLRRTFSTSLSTLVVLIAIFIFGGTSIRGFVFALLIGVVIGTYSSLFIATPIAYDLIMRKEKKSADKNPKKLSRSRK